VASRAWRVSSSPTGELGEDRRQAVQGRAGDPQRGDDLLGLPVRERAQRREVPAGDVVRVLLGHLLDVDPAHVGEEHDRLLADAVPDDAGVVLVLDRRPRVDEDAPRHVPSDLELEHPLGVPGRFVGRLGELHAARLHPSASEHLGFDHHGTGDLLGDLARL